MCIQSLKPVWLNSGSKATYGLILPHTLATVLESILLILGQSLQLPILKQQPCPEICPLQNCSYSTIILNSGEASQARIIYCWRVQTFVDSRQFVLALSGYKSHLSKQSVFAECNDL